MVRAARRSSAGSARCRECSARGAAAPAAAMPRWTGTAAGARLHAEAHHGPRERCSGGQGCPREAGAGAQEQTRRGEHPKAETHSLARAALHWWTRAGSLNRCACSVAGARGRPRGARIAGGPCSSHRSDQHDGLRTVRLDGPLWRLVGDGATAGHACSPSHRRSRPRGSDVRRRGAHGHADQIRGERDFL